MSQVIPSVPDGPQLTLTAIDSSGKGKSFRVFELQEGMGQDSNTASLCYDFVVGFEMTLIIVIFDQVDDGSMRFGWSAVGGQAKSPLVSSLSEPPAN